MYNYDKFLYLPPVIKYHPHFLYKADKNKEEFAKAPMYAFGAGQQDAKVVANSLIDTVYTSNDANKYQVVSQLHRNYGVKGNISKYFEKDLQDPTKFK